MKQNPAPPALLPTLSGPQVDPTMDRRILAYGVRASWEAVSLARLSALSFAQTRYPARGSADFRVQRISDALVRELGVVDASQEADGDDALSKRNRTFVHGLAARRGRRASAARRPCAGGAGALTS